MNFLDREKFENALIRENKVIFNKYIKLGFDKKQAELLTKYREQFLSQEYYDLDTFERETSLDLERSGLFDIWYYRERENNDDLTRFNDDLVEGMFITHFEQNDVRRYITEL